MPKKFRALARETMSPESLERAAVRTEAMLDDMRLNELRRARDLSQQELAGALGMTQPEVSKLERRQDMYLSTLRKYIRAMGGELEIIAHFSTGPVRISQFAELDPTVVERASEGLRFTYMGTLPPGAVTGAAVADHFSWISDPAAGGSLNVSHTAADADEASAVPTSVRRRASVPSIPTDSTLDADFLAAPGQSRLVAAGLGTAETLAGDGV